MVLCVYGAGGNGKTLIDLARMIEKEEHRWDEIVFVDDVTEEKEIYGLKVYRFQQICQKYGKDEVEYVITIGEPFYRKKLYDKVKSEGYTMPVLKNPHAVIPESTVIGEGTILANCYIGSDTVIGVNTIVSEKAVVGHDTSVGNHCNLSMGSFVAGHCQVGDEVYLGPMAAIRDRIEIGDTAVIAMSAAVFKNVGGDMIAIGNPAKCIRKENGYKVFG